MTMEGAAKILERNAEIEKVAQMRELEQGIVSAAKISDGYQCTWCHRILQQPSGLLRHRSFCAWNPANRQTGATRSEPQTDPMKPVSLQCEWCNKFYSNERGVIRHKVYCRWQPQRLRTLKEERKRKREERAVLKRSREDARSARFELAQSRLSENAAKKLEIVLPKSEPFVKSEPMGSVPNSPTSSADTGTSPSSSPEPNPIPFIRSMSYPGIKHEPQFDMDPCAKRSRISQDALAGPIVFSCQTKVRLGNKPPMSRSISADQAVRVPVIVSFDQHCGCGCKKITQPGFHRSFSTGSYLQRKNSLADSPMSNHSLDDEDEFINVDS